MTSSALRPERYRPYLLLVANEVMRPGLRGKVGASDLVQETLLEAHRHFEEFRGGSPGEMRAWLRRILECRLSNLRRAHLKTKKRAAREVSIHREDPAGENRPIEIPCRGPSPSSHAMKREWVETLEAALDRLPTRHRQAIDLRNKQSLSYCEIGERLGCSEDAAQKLWGRAVLMLKELLGEAP